MHPTNNDIGAYLETKRSVAPQSLGASGTVNGAGIDRATDQYGSAVVVLDLGAVAGAPSATSVKAKIQHSDDDTTYVDYNPEGVDVEAEATAANTQARVDVNLSAAKKYIRIVVTAALTGGTTPTVLACAGFVLGGKRRLHTTM